MYLLTIKRDVNGYLKELKFRLVTSPEAPEIFDRSVPVLIKVKVRLFTDDVALDYLVHYEDNSTFATRVLFQIR